MLTRPLTQPLTGPLVRGVGEGGISASAYGAGQAALARATALLAAPNPQVTVGALGPGATASAIPSAVRVSAWDRLGTNLLRSSLRPLGGLAQQATATFPRYDYSSSLRSIVTYAPGTETGVALSYTTNYTGSALDILVRNGGSTVSAFSVYVDDQFVCDVTGAQMTTAGATTGNLSRLPLTFSSSATRLIRIVMRGLDEFGGFDRETTGTLALPSAPAGSRRTLLAGDSYLEGAQAGYLRPFSDWLYPMLGAQDIWRGGSGSTGYVADGTRTSLTDRYTNDIIAQAPDVLVVMMGLNDDSAYGADAAGFRTAVAAMYDAIIAGLPSCKILIFGPWSPKGPGYASANIVAMDADLKAIAAARSIPFVSPLTEGWITGNGNTTATTGNGNSDIYIGSDGTHPNAEGHKYLGWRIAGVLRTHGLA